MIYFFVITFYPMQTLLESKIRKETFFIAFKCTDVEQNTIKLLTLVKAMHDKYWWL